MKTKDKNPPLRLRKHFNHLKYQVQSRKTSYYKHSQNILILFYTFIARWISPCSFFQDILSCKYELFTYFCSY